MSDTNAKVTLSGDATQLEQTLRRAEDAAKKFGDKIERVFSNQVNQIAGMTLGIFSLAEAFSKLEEAVSEGVRLNNSLDKTRQSLATLLNLFGDGRFGGWSQRLAESDDILEELEKKGRYAYSTFDQLADVLEKTSGQMSIANIRDMSQQIDVIVAVSQALQALGGDQMSLASEINAIATGSIDPWDRVGKALEQTGVTAQRMRAAMSEGTLGPLILQGLAPVLADATQGMDSFSSVLGFAQENWQKLEKHLTKKVFEELRVAMMAFNSAMDDGSLVSSVDRIADAFGRFAEKGEHLVEGLLKITPEILNLSGAISNHLISSIVGLEAAKLLIAGGGGVVSGIGQQAGQSLWKKAGEYAVGSAAGGAAQAGVTAAAKGVIGAGSAAAGEAATGAAIASGTAVEGGFLAALSSAGLIALPVIIAAAAGAIVAAIVNANQEKEAQKVKEYKEQQKAAQDFSRGIEDFQANKMATVSNKEGMVEALKAAHEKTLEARKWGEKHPEEMANAALGGDNVGANTARMWVNIASKSEQMEKALAKALNPALFQHNKDLNEWNSRKDYWDSAKGIEQARVWSMSNLQTQAQTLRSGHNTVGAEDLDRKRQWMEGWHQMVEMQGMREEGVRPMLDAQAKAAKEAADARRREEKDDTGHDLLAARMRAVGDEWGAFNEDLKKRHDEIYRKQKDLGLSDKEAGSYADQMVSYERMQKLGSQTKIVGDSLARVGGGGNAVFMGPNPMLMTALKTNQLIEGTNRILKDIHGKTGGGTNTPFAPVGAARFGGG